MPPTSPAADQPRDGAPADPFWLLWGKTNPRIQPRYLHLKLTLT